MVEKTIEIDGKPIQFRASASTPRLYRTLFHRDIFKDLSKLEKSFKKNNDGTSVDFEVNDLEIFENCAYVMAFQADHSIPKDINDWLDQFDMFSIYQILPELLSLWGANLETQVESKKNFTRAAVR